MTTARLGAIMPSLLSQTLGISAKSSSWGWMDKLAQEKRIEERLDAERAGLNDDTKAVVRALGVLMPSIESVDDVLITRAVNAATEDYPSKPPEYRAEKAGKEIEKILAWRAAQEVDSILERDLDNTEEFHRCWPVTTHGSDEFGHPIICERIVDIDAKGLEGPGFAKGLAMMHRVQIMEALDHVKRRTAVAKGHRLHKHVWVIDLGGITTSHLTGSVRTFLYDLISLCQDKYTDTLHAMWLVNAPYVFRAMWSAIKTMVRKSTKDKIQILGESDSSGIQEAMRLYSVSPESMPTCVPGGKHEGVRAWEIVLQARHERRLVREKGGTDSSTVTSVTSVDADFDDSSRGKDN